MLSSFVITWLEMSSANAGGDPSERFMKESREFADIINWVRTPAIKYKDLGRRRGPSRQAMLRGIWSEKSKRWFENKL